MSRAARRDAEVTNPPAPRLAAMGGRGDDSERGMVLMIAAMLIIPGSDAAAKWLSATLSPGEIAFVRFIFQSFFVLPIVLWRRCPPIGSHVFLQMVRGLLLAGVALLFFAGLQVMPLADCTAIFFVEPLVLTLLSALFLGEPIGWRRVVAIVVGFAGALIVIQPSYRVFGAEAILPLAAAVCLAGYLALTRRLSADDDPVALNFSASVFAALALAVALGLGAVGDIAVLAPGWPTGGAWAILALLGAISTIGHLLIVFAFSVAPAGILAPFHYAQIISATILGLVVFGDFPGPLTLVGAAIIVGSGLYVFHRERVVARGARRA